MIGEAVVTRSFNTVDINSGTIDGCDITVGAGKTLDVSAGTLTLANNQISGDKVEGGTIAAITITALTLDATLLTVTGAELNYVSGVTSAIQSQIDLKAPLASPSFTGTVTLPTGLTGVLRGDSGVVSVDSDVTDIVAAASTIAAGKVELAVASEINTGTSATLANTPDALAGSNFGIRYIQMVVFDFVTDMATGDGKFYFHIPPALNGMNLVYCHAENITAGTGTGTDTSDIQIHNVTDAADMLSTKLTIDEDETGSDTAATAYVINGAADDVATNDVLRVDVDAVTPTTAPKGLILTLGFQLP